MAAVTLDGFITEFGGVLNGYFHRKEYYKRDAAFLDNVLHFIDLHNNTDIYYCVYNYENDDINHCKMLGSPYLDFDGSLDSEESFDEVRKEVRMAIHYFSTYWGIPVDMIEIFFSGSKGFHVIIPYEILGLQPDIELNLKFKQIAQLVAKQCNAKHIDMGIYDRKRLFRIPGSINHKSGLYKVPLTYQQLTEYSLEEIREWASEDRDHPFTEPAYVKKSADHYHELFLKKKPKNLAIKKREVVIPNKRKPLLPCALRVLKEGVMQGSRNNTTVALASSLMQSGVSRKDTEAILMDWNESNTPPLSESELITTVSSAYRSLESGLTYGCSSFRDLGYCVGKECRVLKK